MFNTKLFGGYLSRLRKNADMTQSELAEKLNLTRQAVSKYETGESFPDISVLLMIADVFQISINDLINSGEPTKGEATILTSVTTGEEDIVLDNISDFRGVAPLLKPSVLKVLSEGLKQQGIDISSVVSLAEYLSDDTVVELLGKATFETLDEELLEKLMPFLNEESKATIFNKIISGEVDWHLIKTLIPFAEYLIEPIEAAVVEGALPWEAISVVKMGMEELWRRRRKDVV